MHLLRWSRRHWAERALQTIQLAASQVGAHHQNGNPRRPAPELSARSVDGGERSSGAKVLLDTYAVSDFDRITP